MLGDKLRERLLVQESLGLLIEEGLVCRTTTLGDEEELILVTLGCIDSRLCVYKSAESKAKRQLATSRIIVILLWSIR